MTRTIASYLRHCEPAPHEKKNMAIFETSLGMIMTWAVAGAASLLLASMPADTSLDWWGSHQRLICVCIAGGIGGGILSVGIFPRTTLRQNAIKWLVSPVTAGMFGPAFCKFYAIDEDIWYSLAASGAIGLVAWGVLFVIIPLGPVIAKLIAKRYFPSILDGEGGESEADEIKPRRPDWVAREKPRSDTKPE
jgi:hypothetical protein